jgi:hypothetical protein
MNYLSFHVLGIGAGGADQRQCGRSRPEPHGLPPIRTLIVAIGYIFVILALTEKQSQGAETGGPMPNELPLTTKSKLSVGKLPFGRTVRLSSDG